MPTRPPTKPSNSDRQLARDAESRLRAGDLDTAREMFWQLARRIGDAGLWLRVAEIDAARGKAEEAVKSLGRAAGIQPRPWQASARMAELFFELGQPDRSLAILGRESARHGDNPRLKLLLAQAREDAGQRETAIEAYQSALALQPGWPAALGGLLRAAQGEAREEWIELAQRVLRADSLDADERAVLGYSLGRVLEQRSEYDEAFEAWRRANALRRSQSGGLDRQAAEAHVDRQLERYSDHLLAQPISLDRPSRTPVFIVGMPRSGTTLLERMLGAHPEATGLGELPGMGQVVRGLEQLTPQWPQRPESLLDVYPIGELQRAVDFYDRELVRRGAGEAPFVIDKAPMNFFNVGLISLLFPQARVIVCQRDPRDVCLSIFSENFAADQAFATDLDDLVTYYRQYQRLIDHWLRTLPDRVRCIQYEALANEPAAQLEPLLEWLGLAWNDACLAFHEQGGNVATPSRWQVRRPVYRSSIGRWRPFRGHLGPLLDAFGNTPAAAHDSARGDVDRQRDD